MMGEEQVWIINEQTPVDVAFCFFVFFCCCFIFFYPTSHTVTLFPQQLTNKHYMHYGIISVGVRENTFSPLFQTNTELA